MARKTLIHKHTNQTTTTGGVLSPKLPTVGTLEKGEIAVNYKNGYETLSIENDANEVIPFGSLELTMAYTDAAILGNKPLVIEVNDTDATVPSGTYASITAALAIGREVIVKVINDTGDSDHQYYYITNDHAIVGDGFYEFSSPAKGFYLLRVQIYDDDTFGIESDMFITSSDAQSITGYKDFTVSPTVPTAASSSNDTTAASTAFVKTALSNQTHGNITNDGKLQTSDISIANGDKLVVTDSSNSNKIARASLSFDGSTTTKALTQKGTWETFLQTESDPTVPNWAKLLNKPTYTLDEVNDGNTRKLSDYLTLSGGTMTGALTLNGAPSSNLHAATKKYVDDSINELPSPMIFKGSLGTGGTITALPAATASNEGYTYKVITNGTYGGQSAKIGDTFISDGSNWIYIPSGDEPSGTVTNVKIQATSPIAIDDSTAITTSGTRTISHNDSGVTAGTYKSVTVDAKGHVTGGTNPTTLAGYGITDAVTLNTEQTITGKKQFYNSELEIWGGEFKFNYHIERRLRGLSTNDAYANWDSEKKDGTWHRIWRVSFPEGSNFWGKITIGFCGTYASFNASGYIEKEICVAFNGSSLYNNVGRYSALGLNVEKDFRISELVWNSETNQWQILIYSHIPSGNNWPQEVIIKCETANNNTYTSTFEGITVSNAEVSQISSYVNTKATVNGTSKTFYFADLPVYQDPYGDEIAVIDDIPTKTSQLTNDSGFLTSHQLLKTINNESLIGSGNITIQGGGGDTNIIETVKVNGTALTPDANKAVDITVPTAVTESTVSGWGFTKNTGTYSKPSGGIPANDLSNSVQTSLSKADTALQSFTESDPTVPSHVKEITTTDISNWNNKLSSAPVTSVNGQTGAVNLTIPDAVTESTVSGWGFTKNTGTITGITMNGSSKGTSGVVNLGTVLTEHQTLKTINSESIVGTGNLTVSGLPTVTASDNGKVLQVVNGAWSLVMPTAIYSGTSTPNNSVGNDGDLYLLTS